MINIELTNDEYVKINTHITRNFDLHHWNSFSDNKKQTVINDLIAKINKDKVKCCNCGNVISYDFNILDKYFVAIDKHIKTNKPKCTIPILDYFNSAIKCCNEPRYIHAYNL